MWVSLIWLVEVFKGLDFPEQETSASELPSQSNGSTTLFCVSNVSDYLAEFGPDSPHNYVNKFPKISLSFSLFLSVSPYTCLYKSFFQSLFLSLSVKIHMYAHIFVKLDYKCMYTFIYSVYHPSIYPSIDPVSLENPE